MVVSHSCDVSNAPFIIISPIFLDSELTWPTMNIIKGNSFNSQADADKAKGNWFLNENLKIAAFSAQGADINERFLVPLNLFMTIDKISALKLNPFLRLTYRALAFFQWRLAVVYFRDVKDSDETRDYLDLYILRIFQME